MENKIIKRIVEEHEDIERELKELETIMYNKKINYPNLLHVLKKLYPLWDKHEEKEEVIFSILKNKGLEVQTKKMLFEHKQLKGHKRKIEKAINSGSDKETKDILKRDGKDIIKKLREHIDNEENELYSLALEIIFSAEEENKISSLISK